MAIRDNGCDSVDVDDVVDLGLTGDWYAQRMTSSFLRFRGGHSETNSSASGNGLSASALSLSAELTIARWLPRVDCLENGLARPNALLEIFRLGDFAKSGPFDFSEPNVQNFCTGIVHASGQVLGVHQQIT
jgi:hypothetical protein